MSTKCSVSIYSERKNARKGHFLSSKEFLTTSFLVLLLLVFLLLAYPSSPFKTLKMHSVSNIDIATAESKVKRN